MLLFPSEGKKTKKKKDRKKTEKKPVKKEEDTEKKSKSFEEIIDFISDIREIASVVLKKLGNHIKLKVEEYDIFVAGFDASTIALLYGGLQMVFGNLFAALEKCKWFSVSDKCKGINADFLAEKASVKFVLNIGISALGAVAVLLPAAKKYLSMKKGEKERGK